MTAPDDSPRQIPPAIPLGAPGTVRGIVTGGSAPEARRDRRGPWALVALGLVLALPEAVLELADAGLLGTPAWRPLAYTYGAFWSGLLRDWRPNYALQPALMFVTYALLHNGPGHLLGNLAGLAWLGPPLARRLGARRVLLAFWASALAGGAAFASLDAGPAPMVGASGAVFGLAGLLATLGWRLRQRAGVAPWPALSPSLGLALLLLAANLLSWWVQGGLLAWQAHLGGALAGAFLGAVLALPALPQRPILAKRRS